MDYSLINDIILRPVFPLASPEMVWRGVPKGKGRWWISNDLTVVIGRLGFVRSLYLWGTLCIVKDDKDRSLLFVEDRVFVPESERITTMECLHLSHLGFANTFSVARSRYFWEGMKADLLKFIGRCGLCIEYQNHRPFEMTPP